MATYVPDYYSRFICKADKCKHNCCIGWEIDIDSASYEYYKTIDGQFGDKLRKSIFEQGVLHFILRENDRCPFLNDNNLCDIIITLGSDKLCDICTEHPRFRNFYSGRVEIGLGMCCEAAADLILNNKNLSKLVKISDDEDECTAEEESFFIFRENIFKIIQNRSVPFDDRIKKLECYCEVDLQEFAPSKWSELLSSFEILDPCWMSELDKLRNFNGHHDSILNSFDTVFEQLVTYFIYRHLSEGVYDGKLLQRIKFCIISYAIIKSLCQIYFEENGLINRDIIADFSRRYSAEIEYSEDNTEKMINAV